RSPRRTRRAADVRERAANESEHPRKGSAHREPLAPAAKRARLPRVAIRRKSLAAAADDSEATRRVGRHDDFRPRAQRAISAPRGDNARAVDAHDDQRERAAEYFAL